MYTEKYMKAKTAYLIRNIGLLRFVPILMLDAVALAMIALSASSRTDMWEIENDFLMISQYIFPLFSVWWSVFILREFIEADGNEVFFAAGMSNVMFYAFKPFLLLLGNVAVLMAVCTVIDVHFAIEFARIFSTCIFYFGLVYFVSMCFKSTAIALFSVIIYTILCAVIRTMDVKFPLFMSFAVLEPDDLLTLCLPLSIAGIVLVLIGRFAEKRFFTFN